MYSRIKEECFGLTPLKPTTHKNKGRTIYLIALNGDADGEEACDVLTLLKPTTHKTKGRTTW
jgi:hypothetical protein